VSAFPLRYAHANILFGRGDERAALFSLETISYPFRTDRDKIAELKRLAQFAFAIEADFSLWRVCRAYPAERYLEQAAGLLDERHQSRARWTDYLTGHEHHLAALESYVPEVYVAISLRAGAPSRLGGNLLRSWDRTRRRLEDLLGVGAPQPVGSGELDAPSPPRSAPSLAWPPPSAPAPGGPPPPSCNGSRAAPRAAGSASRASIRTGSPTRCSSRTPTGKSSTSRWRPTWCASPTRRCSRSRVP